jgi:3,4-dihydroxy 2-butanone 4-phosphate synthase/GTP cyclohydrolase II
MAQLGFIDHSTRPLPASTPASPDRLDRVRTAVAAITAGHPVIVVGREGAAEVGNLVLAAERATTGSVAFFVRHTSGFLRVALSEKDCRRLGLPPMDPLAVDAPTAGYRVTVDAIQSGTGISAADRGRTIRTLADPAAIQDDFTRPGHVVPVAVREDVLPGRPAPADAAVELVRRAGYRPTALLDGIVSTNGRTGMASRAELDRLAADHGLSIVTVDDLVAHLPRHG